MSHLSETLKPKSHSDFTRRLNISPVSPSASTGQVVYQNQDHGNLDLAHTVSIYLDGCGRL